MLANLGILDINFLVKSSLLLFLIGFCGLFVVRRSIIIVLICLEVLLFSVNLNLVTFSIMQDSVYGQVFALIVLAVAAAESSIGLALLIVYFRISGIITLDRLGLLKG